MKEQHIAALEAKSGANKVGKIDRLVREIESVKRTQEKLSELAWVYGKMDVKSQLAVCGTEIQRLIKELEEIV
jgi:hypothetical protein